MSRSAARSLSLGVVGPEALSLSMFCAGAVVAFAGMVVVLFPAGGREQSPVPGCLATVVGLGLLAMAGAVLALAR